MKLNLNFLKRVVAPGDNKQIGEYLFKNFNSHSNSYPCSYLTCAAAIGMKKEEVDSFIKRLQKILDSAKHENNKEPTGDGHLPMPKD